MKSNIIKICMSVILGIASLQLVSCRRPSGASPDLSMLVLYFKSNNVVGQVESIPPIKKDILQMVKVTLDGSGGEQAIVLARCESVVAAKKSLVEMQQNPSFTHCSQNECVVMALAFRRENRSLAEEIEMTFSKYRR